MTLKMNDNGTNRNMTKAEEAAHLAWTEEAQAEAQARADALASKQAARQAVLDKLGLTADEAQALLG